MNVSTAHQSAIRTALDLAGRGLAVFPMEGRIAPVGWQKSATTDPAQVRDRFAWFCRFINQASAPNVGVACRASRIVGLDLDVHGQVDGLAVLASLAERLGQPWPQTLTVSTPSGGRHLYFRVPDDCTIGSFSGGRTRLGPGIDVRGPGLRTGGYLVGPGSTWDGGRYDIQHDIAVLPLPGWIADRLRAPGG